MAIQYEHPQYTYYKVDWVKIRDVLAGERKIHDKGTTYLPKLSTRQTETSYDAYKARARFYNASKRTLLGWTGAVFRRLPSVAVPPGLEDRLLDINLQATPVKDFARQSLVELLTTGRIGILAEHQADPNGRAYLLLFKAEEIINWAYTVIDGVKKLTMVLLCYTVSELAEDGFSYNTITEYRELRLVNGIYIQNIYHVGGENKEWSLVSTVTPQVRGEPFTEIPFVFIGTESLSPDIQESPLLEIATINLHHYKRSADLCHGLHLSALPTPYTLNASTSEDDTPVELGSGVMQNFNGTGVAVGFLEWGGSGINAVRQDMIDMKEEMASLGASAITPPLRMAETAQAIEAKHDEQSAPLVNVVDVLSQGLTEALSWLVYWEGGDETSTSLSLNKQFVNSKLSAADIKALSESLQIGAISEELFAFLLESAESLPPQVDYKLYAQELMAKKAARSQQTPAPISNGVSSTQM